MDVQQRIARTRRDNFIAAINSLLLKTFKSPPTVAAICCCSAILFGALLACTATGKDFSIVFSFGGKFLPLLKFQIFGTGPSADDGSLASNASEVGGEASSGGFWRNSILVLLLFVGVILISIFVTVACVVGSATITILSVIWGWGKWKKTDKLDKGSVDKQEKTSVNGQKKVL